MRVASVLPSATEILCFIGGERLLVGRSHEDNFPPQITSLPVITGQTTTFTTAAEVDRVVSDSIGKGQSLYTLDAPLIESLSPDVILTQDICSVCAIDLQTVERLAAKMTPRPKVVSLNPLNLDDVLANVLQLGEAVGMAEEARAAHASLVERIAAVDRRVEQRRRQLGEGRRRPRVAFIEWSDPLYVGGHWTPQLIERAGGEHPLNAGGESGGGKSFPVPPSAVVEADPDLVILAPCGLTLDMTRREATSTKGRGQGTVQEPSRSFLGDRPRQDGVVAFATSGPRGARCACRRRRDVQPAGPSAGRRARVALLGGPRRARGGAAPVPVRVAPPLLFLATGRGQRGGGRLAGGRGGRRAEGDRGHRGGACVRRARGQAAVHGPGDRLLCLYAARLLAARLLLRERLPPLRIWPRECQAGKEGGVAPPHHLRDRGVTLVRVCGDGRLRWAGRCVAWRLSPESRGH
uniref:Fe/B12 periplasmic-binding domain-containing protein n=1 Tax=Emiliania huxleyi TaxID=2903 RepID=A0A7S3X0H4_EMIHU